MAVATPKSPELRYNSCTRYFHFAGMMPFLMKTSPAKAITIHGLLDRWAIRHGYWKKKIVSALVQKKIVASADVIQINNLDEEQDLLNYLGRKHPNVAIIPNGMKTDDFANMPQKGTFRQQWDIATTQPVVLFMGRLNIKKGLDLLLPAFGEYVKQNPAAVLVLAGPDDGYLAATQQFIAENRLQKNIRLVGMLIGNDKLMALADADIFVLPSYSEGFSIAVLEAMAAGVPVLVSDRVGFGEVIKTTQAGHLVDLSVDSVGQGIVKMLADKNYSNALSINALNLVKTRYDMEIVAKHLIEAFRKACACHNLKFENDYKKN